MAGSRSSPPGWRTAAERSPRRGSTSRGSRGSCSPGKHVRLRGRPGRYGFDVRSFDLNGVVATADFAPVYPASEEVTPKKLREVVGAALVHARDLPRPAAGGAEAARRTAAAGRCAVGAAPAALQGRGGDRPPAARLRGAARPPARAAAEAPGRRESRRARVGGARGADRALSEGPSLRAHARPGESHHRDRRGPRPLGPDAAAPPGRRRLGQDGGGAVRASARGRGGIPRRVHGADRDARRTALSHGGGALPADRRQRRPADQLRRRRGSATPARASSSARTRSSRRAST